MMMLTVTGNVGKDAVLRRTHDDQPVLNFSVAVTKVERSTPWVDCSLWGRCGEALAEFVTNDSKVTVVGEASLVEHNGKSYMKVRAYDIELQGGGKRESDGVQPSPRGPSSAQRPRGAAAGGRLPRRRHLLLDDNARRAPHGEAP